MGPFVSLLSLFHSSTLYLPIFISLIHPFSHYVLGLPLIHLFVNSFFPHSAVLSFFFFFFYHISIIHSLFISSFSIFYISFLSSILSLSPSFFPLNRIFLHLLFPFFRLSGTISFPVHCWIIWISPASTFHLLYCTSTLSWYISPAIYKKKFCSGSSADLRENISRFSRLTHLVATANCLLWRHWIRSRFLFLGFKFGSRQNYFYKIYLLMSIIEGHYIYLDMIRMK